MPLPDYTAAIRGIYQQLTDHNATTHALYQQVSELNQTLRQQQPSLPALPAPSASPVYPASADALGSLLAAWHAQFGITPILLVDLIANLDRYPFIATIVTAWFTDQPRDTWGKLLGYRLRAARGRIAAGYMLCQHNESRRRGVHWYVVVFDPAAAASRALEVQHG